MFTFFKQIGVGIISVFAAFTGAFHHADTVITPSISVNITATSTSSQQVQNNLDGLKQSPKKQVKKTTSVVDDSVTLQEKAGVSKDTVTTQQKTDEQTQVQVQQETQVYCNGKYYNPCPTGEKFICSNDGSFFCQSQAAAEEQAREEAYAIKQQQDKEAAEASNTAYDQAVQEAQQRKQSAEYSTQIKALQQQIIDIKTKALQQAQGYMTSGTSQVAEGEAAMIIDEANRKIEQINLQIQQLQLNNQ